MSKKYQESGVNLEAGYESVERIKKHVAKTKIKGSLSNIGAFGGLFDLSSYNYKNPVLVSGTDGVGTKLVISQMVEKYDTVGIDLVAMCVNDIITTGAKPLIFLDYIAIGKNNPQIIEDIVKGVSDGCILANCDLVGGETAEMPDMYDRLEFDLAGFSVGCVEKDKIIDNTKIKENDVVIGLKSSGIHSNGYSLVRKILFKDNNISLDYILEGKPLKEYLLEPTKIYVNSILNLIKKVNVLGIANITGGGFYENIPRCLNNNQGVFIDSSKFEILPIFKFLMEKGNVDYYEMFNVFNMGIGMVLIVKKEDVKKTLEILKENNEQAYEIGYVTNNKGVIIK